MSLQIKGFAELQAKLKTLEKKHASRAMRRCQR